MDKKYMKIFFTALLIAMFVLLAVIPFLRVEAQSTPSIQKVVDGVEKFRDTNGVICYATTRTISGSSPFKYSSISCVK
jgi:hypothetical protein